MASTGARIVDISVGGVGVETARQLIPGRSYSLQLGGGEDPLAVRGMVRWCRLCGIRRGATGERVTVYHSGVALGDMLTESAQRIVSLIQRVADLTPGERLFARIRPRNADSASVESTLGVRVNRIGVRGVVVDSELPLEPETQCDLSLNLDGGTFEARAFVVGVETRPEAAPDRRVRLELELVEVSPTSRKLLAAYIGAELERRSPRRPQAPPSAAPAPPAEPPALVGNLRSLVAHRTDCRRAIGRARTIPFAGVDDALAAGYRPCRLCRPFPEGPAGGAAD